jgi:hypothetical protein
VAYASEENVLGDRVDQFADFSKLIESRDVGTPQGRIEVIAIVDCLCEIYTQVTPQERSEIRELVASNKAVLEWVYRYSGLAIHKLLATRASRWLQRSLLGISIVDQRTDIREYYLRLTTIYVIAAQVGFDAKPYFIEASRLSSSTAHNPMSRRSTQNLLSNFHTMSIFKTEVQPRLAQLRNKGLSQA